MDQDPRRPSCHLPLQRNELGNWSSRGGKDLAGEISTLVLTEFYWRNVLAESVGSSCHNKPRYTTTLQCSRFVSHNVVLSLQDEQEILLHY